MYPKQVLPDKGSEGTTFKCRQVSGTLFRITEPGIFINGYEFDCPELSDESCGNIGVHSCEGPDL